MRRWVLVALSFAGVASLTSVLSAQVPATGEEMYRQWCAVCHGEDGRGKPRERPVPTVPMDLTDCRLTTPETDADWVLVITHGGVAAGRSADMPGFEMLPDAAVREILLYVRALCRDSRWPSGNLNSPRSVFTPKAFPENEVVLQSAVSHGRDSNPRARLDASYATRIGPRGEVEITVPAETVTFSGRRVNGIGDVTVEGRYVLYANDARAAIASVGIETSCRTGSRRWAFGEGTTVYHPFLSAGVVRHLVSLQADLRAILPVRKFPTEPVHYLEYGVSVLRAWSTSPTAWTVGVEVNGIDTSVAVAPEVAKRLTRTGALWGGIGVQIPVRPVPPLVRGVTRWSGYLAWDYLEPIRSRR